VNSKNIIDKYEKDISSYQEQLAENAKSIEVLEEENFELNYFNIDRNQEAIDYFESQGYDTDELIPAIKEGLYDMNDYEGDEHPIVPFVSLTGNKLIINKVRILNHKWIVANFTDGEYWGEIFLTYEVDDSGIARFDLSEYFMYPKL
jgi:hypothetical protein